MAKTVRCGVYTRKSSEEGLEQSFNSLDAQREACMAYTLSQKHEGWVCLPEMYDDGGFSGGNMERPALVRLLADIDAGRIDTVVVYKVDRLTRSLMDFAKIVERFDAKGVSFVSVTQHFNTTSSMGRLTLNVLLSFAQFEREVTGERIRDKIAASKRKGMWMGGNIPIGYDVVDRKLAINAPEAEIVKKLFDRYMKLGCVRKLKAEFDAKGIKSKVKVSKAGRTSGGFLLSRGAIYKILKSRLYLGEVIHKGKQFPGQHEAIISQETWEAVQKTMDANRQGKIYGTKAKDPSLLAGMIFDARGNRLTPSHAKKKGLRYRYYVSPTLTDTSTARIRAPAHDIEELVTQRIEEFLSSPNEISGALVLPTDDAIALDLLTAAATRTANNLKDCTPARRQFLIKIQARITLHDEFVDITLPKQKLRTTLMLVHGEGHDETGNGSFGDEEIKLTITANVRRCGRQMRFVLPSNDQWQTKTRQDPTLLKAVARGYAWLQKLTSGEVGSILELAQKMNVHHSYVTKIVKCALLAPNIVEQVLEGRQTAQLTLNRIVGGLPIAWHVQMKLQGRCLW